MKFNLFSKIRNLFSRKESAVANILVSPGSGGTIWIDEDYENFSRETYIKNIICFRCIDIISKSCSTVPWKIYKMIEKNKEEIKKHPLIKITRRPNPEEGKGFFVYKLFAYLLITGNSYVERVSPLTGSNKGIPKELYSLRPDRMTINVNKQNGRKKGYTYKTVYGEQFFEIDPVTSQANILHLKTFHPTDDWYGMGVTKPAAREIDTNNEAVNWNKKLLENEGRPGMVFTVVGNLSQKQFDRLEKRLQEEYSGASNAGKNLILEGEKGTGVKPFGLTPQELDFIEGNRELARRICYAYGVPPMLLGIPGDNTYSNYQEARLALWEDTIIPWLDFLKDEWNNWFFPLDEELTTFLEYDLSKISALAPRREIQWKRAQESDFLKLDEKRDLAGFDSLENGTGDVVYLPANMIPIGTSIEEEGSEEIITEEVEKGIIELVNQGFSKIEAYEMLGLPVELLEEEKEPDESKPYPNEFSCRIERPDQFTSFRRRNNAAQSNGKRLDFIYGIKEGKSKLQAIRYPKSQWSRTDAKNHCGKRDHILFE